jgi:hypothetical protein
MLPAIPVTTIHEGSCNAASLHGGSARDCRITKALAATTDSAKSEDLTERMDDLLGAPGSDAMTAVHLAHLVDPKTEDGMALENAMDTLDEKCAK